MGHRLTSLQQNENRNADNRATLACLRAGLGTGDGEPLVGSISQTTTFARSGIGSDPEHQYSRVSNPSVSALETALGEMEAAEPAVCFSSGLAAETALFLTLLSGGGHVVCGRSVYGGTSRLLTDVLPGFGVSCTFVDATDPRNVADAINDRTRLVLIETPSNPTLELTDIRAVASLTKPHGITLAVDNTFMTAVLQQPLDQGADVSVYSTTKFVDGHSVAPGGAIVSRDPRLLARLRRHRKSTGGIQTPMGAWLTCNGLKTLPVRMREQSRSARRIAHWLEERRVSGLGIGAVYYPGLSGADRRIVEQQHTLRSLGEDESAGGAVVSFVVDGGPGAVRGVAESIRLCSLVEHVGSVGSLLTHPASMTHADVDPSERERIGIKDGLLRLSVGLEPVDEIIADLERGLESVNGLAREADPRAGVRTEGCHA